MGHYDLKLMKAEAEMASSNVRMTTIGMTLGKISIGVALLGALVLFGIVVSFISAVSLR